MAKLGKRPAKVSGDKAELWEKIFQYYDDSLRLLDGRRIAQQTAVEEGATDADTIVNLLAAINALIAVLNASDLTEE